MTKPKTIADQIVDRLPAWFGLPLLGVCVVMAIGTVLNVQKAQTGTGTLHYLFLLFRFLGEAVFSLWNGYLGVRLLSKMRVPRD